MTQIFICELLNVFCQSLMSHCLSVLFLQWAFTLSRQKYFQEESSSDIRQPSFLNNLFFLPQQNKNAQNGMPINLRRRKFSLQWRFPRWQSASILFFLQKPRQMIFQNLFSRIFLLPCRVMFKRRFFQHIIKQRFIQVAANKGTKKACRVRKKQQKNSLICVNAGSVGRVETCWIY